MSRGRVMIVRMRSCAQAAKVAEATGGVQLAGKPKPDGTPTFSRYVEIGVDFEAHRPVVESVSVLFELYDGDANSYAATGGRVPNCRRAGWSRRRNSRSSGPPTRSGRVWCVHISAPAAKLSTGAWPR